MDEEPAKALIDSQVRHVAIVVVVTLTLGVVGLFLMGNLDAARTPTRPTMIVLGIVAVMVIVALAGSFDDGSGGSGGGGGTPLPTDAAVISRIRSLTNCDELQREFDTAAANHDIQSDQGDVTMMGVASEYMAVVDDRMESVGSYG